MVFRALASAVNLCQQPSGYPTYIRPIKTKLCGVYIKSGFVLLLSSEFLLSFSIVCGSEFVSSFDADEMMTRAVLDSPAMQRGWVQ